MESWWTNSLESRFGCTYPYMHLFRDTKLPSCPPLTLIQNYRTTIIDEKYNFHNCALACDRWEYDIVMERTSEAPGGEYSLNNVTKAYTFFADISYNDLQYEQLTEVATETFTGLIAQIGGQLSLFLGSSMINIVQLVLLTTLLCRRGIHRRTIARTAPENEINRPSRVAPETIHPQSPASNIHRDSLWTAMPMRSVDHQRVVY